MLNGNHCIWRYISKSDWFPRAKKKQSILWPQLHPKTLRNLQQTSWNIPQASLNHQYKRNLLVGGLGYGNLLRKTPRCFSSRVVSTHTPAIAHRRQPPAGQWNLFSLLIKVKLSYKWSYSAPINHENKWLTMIISNPYISGVISCLLKKGWFRGAWMFQGSGL